MSDFFAPPGTLLPYGKWRPKLFPGAFVADTARLIGRVTLKRDASVWYGAVLRGDINRIEIGVGTNIQDASVLHLEDHAPCIVGDEAVVGHSVTLHGCRVGDGALIGIGAVVLTGAVVGEGSLVGAGTLVSEKTRIPPGSLVLGMPGKVVRRLGGEERKMIRKLAAKYVRVARQSAQSQHSPESWSL